MAVATSTDNVNSFFFDGHYKEVWRSFIPDELTKRELDFIVQYFNLTPDSNVLDIMCGYGRHAIGLGRKGYRVTAVDNLSDYISDIQKTVAGENLSVQFIQSDILSYTPSGRYDLIICMGNSINFFDEHDSVRLMKTITDSLVPGGHFLINTWSLAEIVIKNFESKTWAYDGDYKMLTDSEFLFNPTRVETEYIMIDKKGHEEIKKGIDYIFSLSEMQRMLENAGCSVKDVFSIPGKKKFSLGDPRAYIVAEKK
jgi:SAM-dependent methyltransferase